MDKEEFRVKLDQINHLVEKNDYKGAMEVVDSIDWRRVKNVRTLCVVGEIYAANKRYEDSKEIFLLAYHRAPIGKNILYRLIEVSLKTGNIEEAMEYYEEYLQVAPNDSTKYILKYKIYKENHADIDSLIKILEDYKEKEFTEKWSYELAKLYYQAGEKEKCLSVCNEMSLWFSDGKYVMKAMDLKMKLGALTDAEKEKFEKQFQPKLITVEQMREQKAEANADAENTKENNEETSETEKEESPVESDSETSEAPEESEENNSMIGSISTREEDVNYSQSIQEKISKGIRDIFNSKKREEKAEEENAVPEEMLKDAASEEELEAASVLEEENGSVKEEKTEKRSIKIPELRIPKGIKKVGKEEGLQVPEAPKIPKVALVSPKTAEEKEFNLEDTILAAASEQGIEIPKENALEEESQQEYMEEVSEEKEYFEEEAENDVSEEEYFEEEIEDDVSEEEEYFEEETEDDDSEEETFVETDSNEIDSEMLDLQKELKETLAKDENYPWISPRAERRTEELREYVVEEDAIEKEPEKPQTDPLDIVPREHAFTEEELELFSYFVSVPGMDDQILDALVDAQNAAADKTSRTGNIVVMGGRETGKTKLISALIPAICKELHLEASKVAYVFSDQINGKDIPEIIDKLSSGFLVIEEANQLDKQTVEQLDKAMDFRTDGLTVILEDEKIGMRKFMTRYPKFAKKFTSVISIPVFTNDELVRFADVYTRENGFAIDQVGMEALYNLISSNQKADEPMSIGVVKELLDAAIRKSQSGLLKLKRKRTNEEGFMILTDKDFNI